MSIWSSYWNLDLFLYSYEREFLDSLVRSGHRKLARSFNLCYRYIDLSWLDCFQQQKFIDYVRDIYPFELNVEKADRLHDQANYLDLTFIIGNNNRLYTKPYDKRDDFNFRIVNFSFLSSKIPSGPSYGVYISQLIRYARCCTYYDNFGYHHKLLVDSLLSQGYKVNRLTNSFQKVLWQVFRCSCKVSEVSWRHDEGFVSFFNTVDLCYEGFVDLSHLQDLSL